LPVAKKNENSNQLIQSFTFTGNTVLPLSYSISSNGFFLPVFPRCLHNGKEARDGNSKGHTSTCWAQYGLSKYVTFVKYFFD
jgi:hypothetical protein